MKIIIPDAQSRKAFDIINILQREHGYELLLFAPPGNKTQLRLIYGQRIYPLSNNDFDSFRIDLLSAIKKDNAADYIWMAVSEEPTLLFYDLIEKEPDIPIKFKLPERTMFEVARNKMKFQFFCEERNLPVPESFTSENLMGLKQNFRPIIAKKRIGAGSVGMKYVNKPEQLSILENVDSEEYLIQERVQSSRKIHGFFCLASEGNIISWHGHERLRTFPEKGGVTVFSRTQYIPELKKISTRVLKEMNWSGFAMIEFLHDDQSGKWKIIELNPRLWGSIMLSEFCGANMLSNYVKLLSNESPEEGEKLKNRYIRWIFPFEVISLLKGSINFGDFFNRQGLNTCYINVSYSSKFRAVMFQAFFTFNGRSIARFFKKLIP